MLLSASASRSVELGGRLRTTCLSGVPETIMCLIATISVYWRLILLGILLSVHFQKCRPVGTTLPRGNRSRTGTRNEGYVYLSELGDMSTKSKTFSRWLLWQFSDKQWWRPSRRECPASWKTRAELRRCLYMTDAWGSPATNLATKLWRRQLPKVPQSMGRHKVQVDVLYR